MAPDPERLGYRSAIDATGSNDARAPEISAVVCTRHRGERVAATVASILASDHPSFELVVIDQSLDDVTEQAVARFTDDPRLRYVRSATAGLGRARNLGLDEARAGVIAFTDDDVTVPPDWLTVMAATFERFPDAAVAFCSVVEAPHDSSAGFIPVYRCDGVTEVSTMRGKCRARGIGAGMSVRRDPVVALGGFDPSLGAGGRFPSCEDGDVAVRALLAGHTVVETDETSVVHDGFRTWSEGRELTKRDFFGIGAAYAKPLKAGHPRAAIVVAYEGIWRSLLSPLAELARFRRPTGLKRFVHFWRGFVAGCRTPIDRDTMRFVEAATEPDDATD